MTVASVTYDNLRVQYWDGAAWQDFGPVQDLSPAKRTRRFAASRDILTDKIRIVARRETDAGGTVHIDAVSMKAAGEAPAVLRQIPFNFDTSQYYSFWLTDGHADIFANGVFLSSIALPYSEAQLGAVTYAQALDTLILFHPDIAPQRVFRQGRHTAWAVGDLPLQNLPLYDYAGTNSGGVNAQQQIRFRDYVAGDIFNLTLGGESTTSITFGASVGLAIASALRALKSVDPDGVSVTGSGNLWTVEFTGKNGGREWPEMFGKTISSDAGGVVVSTSVIGKTGGENVISAVRGWPRCGAFMQQRLFLGGLRSRPSTWLASVAGDYFNFNIDLNTADAALDVTLDGEDVIEIRHISGGRRPAFFCAGAEYYLDQLAVTRDNLSVIHASSAGAREGVRPLMLDGPLLFLERRSGAPLGLVYTNEASNYEPEPIAINAAHLLPDPMDMARRRRRSVKEADLITFVNNGGPMAALTLLRKHDIVAFSRFTTDGQFLACGVENKYAVEVAVRRGDVVWIERLSDDCWLDNSLTVTGEDVTQIGAAHLDGKTVAVLVNGAFFGRYQVVNGLITLPYAMSGTFEVGLEYTVQGHSLPLRRPGREGGLNKDKFRVPKIDFNVQDSVAFEVSTDQGADWYPLEPSDTGYAPDDPAVRFGNEIVPHEGSGFWDKRPDVRFRTMRPGPFHLKSIDMEFSG